MCVILENVGSFLDNLNPPQTEKTLRQVRINKKLPEMDSLLKKFDNLYKQRYREALRKTIEKKPEN